MRNRACHFQNIGFILPIKQKCDYHLHGIYFWWHFCHLRTGPAPSHRSWLKLNFVSFYRPGDCSWAFSAVLNLAPTVATFLPLEMYVLSVQIRAIHFSIFYFFFHTKRFKYCSDHFGFCRHVRRRRNFNATFRFRHSCKHLGITNEISRFSVGAVATVAKPLITLFGETG